MACASSKWKLEQKVLIRARYLHFIHQRMPRIHELLLPNGQRVKCDAIPVIDWGRPGG
jgi:hypothetical protein